MFLEQLTQLRQKRRRVKRAVDFESVVGQIVLIVTSPTLTSNRELSERLAE